MRSLGHIPPFYASGRNMTGLMLLNICPFKIFYVQKGKYIYTPPYLYYPRRHPLLPLISYNHLTHQPKFQRGVYSSPLPTALMGTPLSQSPSDRVNSNRPLYFSSLHPRFASLFYSSLKPDTGRQAGRYTVTLVPICVSQVYSLWREIKTWFDRLFYPTSSRREESILVESI